MADSNNMKRVFLDIDIDNARKKYQRAKDFVAATNLKYGFDSQELEDLGGSQRAQVKQFYSTDFEWSTKGDIILTLPPQRIVIDLYSDVPKAVENFTTLITGSKGKSRKSGKDMHYVNCPFHRIVPGFICQSGDYIKHNGSGGESIWGKKFKDERSGLKKKLDKRGLVAMCNTGKNSNTSQFFFTFAPCKKLNGKHVVFGEISDGEEVLRLIEAAGTEKGEPTQPVIIADCGIL